MLAVRRRVQITQQMFPRASIALYDEQCSTNQTVIAGYRRASALGLFDEMVANPKVAPDVETYLPPATKSLWQRILDMMYLTGILHRFH